MSEENEKTPVIKVQQRLMDKYIYFDTLQEFEEYYLENQDSIEAEHTRTLNGKYKINGFKITRRKGEITAVPVEKKNTQDDMMEVIKLISDKVDVILDKLNSKKY